MKTYLLKDRPGYNGIPLMAFSTKQGTGAVPHTHDFVEIVLVREGHTLHGWWEPDGRRNVRTITKGDIYGIMPGEVHEYVNNHGFKTYNLAFMPSFPGEDGALLSTLPFWNGMFRREPLRLTPQEYSNAEWLFVRLMKELRQTNGKDYHYLLARAFFMEYLAFIGSRAESRSVNLPNTPDERIFQAAREIEEHITDGISVQKLAKSTGFCYSMFTEKFKRLYGVPPQEYMMSLRLEYACHLLEESDSPISEIASKTRFYDTNHLLKLFRKRYGMTPTQYRRKIRE